MLRTESLGLEEIELPVACACDFEAPHDEARTAKDMALDLNTTEEFPPDGGQFGRRSGWVPERYAARQRALTGSGEPQCDTPGQ